MAEEVMKSIYTVNLGVKPDETVLVFTDTGGSNSPDETSGELEDIARGVAEAGRELCRVSFQEFPSLGGHGKEPPEALWRAAFGDEATEELKGAGLLEKILAKSAAPEDIDRAEEIVKRLAHSPNAVIALSRHSTSHTRFRDLLTRCKGARYASMPLFDRAMLTGVMTADWKQVAERTERLVSKLDGAETVYITSHNGTSITFSVRGRDFHADTGLITEKGSFGNLPAGEAFLAPVEGTAEGTLVLEWAPTGKLKRSVELTVDKGEVVEVSGEGDLAEDLAERIEANPLCGNIAELGIGTNDKATRPDNILETEKILGTVHIALGDNSSFGGKVSVPFHQDFIFFRPSMEILRGGEKVEILIEGEPRF